MKAKILAILLALTCMFSFSIYAFAEEEETENTIDQEMCDEFVECFKEFAKEYFANKNQEENVEIDVDEVSDEISTLSPEEAYLTYAKTCAGVLSACGNEGYNIVVPLNNYKEIDFMKAAIRADDFFSIKENAPMNSEENDYKDLESAVSAYKDLQMNIAILESLMKSKPEVPEKYEHTDKYIEDGFKNITDLNDLINEYLDGSSDMSNFSLWAKAEKLYWSDNILNLRAMYYLDYKVN